MMRMTPATTTTTSTTIDAGSYERCCFSSAVRVYVSALSICKQRFLWTWRTDGIWRGREREGLPKLNLVERCNYVSKLCLPNRMNTKPCSLGGFGLRQQNSQKFALQHRENIDGCRRSFAQIACDHSRRITAADRGAVEPFSAWFQIQFVSWRICDFLEGEVFVPTGFN